MQNVPCEFGSVIVHQLARTCTICVGRCTLRVATTRRIGSTDSVNVRLCGKWYIPRVCGDFLDFLAVESEPISFGRHTLRLFRNAKACDRSSRRPCRCDVKRSRRKRRRCDDQVELQNARVNGIAGLLVPRIPNAIASSAVSGSVRDEIAVHDFFPRSPEQKRAFSCATRAR